MHRDPRLYSKRKESPTRWSSLTKRTSHRNSSTCSAASLPTPRERAPYPPSSVSILHSRGPKHTLVNTIRRSGLVLILCLHSAACCRNRSCGCERWHKVSLFADGDVKLTESHVVSEYLDTAYPKAGPKLFPIDAKNLAKARLHPHPCMQNE